MKYLKHFESNDFNKENDDILKTIDILISFTEDLSRLGFEEGFIPKRPIEAYARLYCGQRYDIHQFSKYVKDNISNSIPTIEWTVSGSAKNIDDREMELACDEFMSKLEDFVPNCRITNFRKKVEKDSMIIYTKGEYETTDKVIASISLSMVDSNKTRYRD